MMVVARTTEDEETSRLLVGAWDSETVAEDVPKTALQLDGEVGVEDRVHCAVEEGYGVRKGADGLRNDVCILAPDVDEMDDKVRSPAGDEAADDTQRHLNRLYLRFRDAALASKGRTALRGRLR